ncbi:MAG: RraA family protein [Acidobacteria bacterium]|nr:RraA family protein [Acidobacteriota bacterium]
MPVRVLAAVLPAAFLVLVAATPPGALHSSAAGVPPVESAPVQAGAAMTPDDVIAALRLPENSTGNIADAVEAATGGRGWMSADMKPISERKIVGRAWTAALRPVLKHDDRTYPNYALEILDEAPAGSVLVYVLEGNVEIAGMGNLMAATAQVRGLEATVIDGAIRDIEEVREIGHQVFARRISPATSVGRLVSISKQTPVKCAEVMVHPGDYIVGDLDGVVVVPQAAAEKVVALLADYDARESKMLELIRKERSMLKALEIYGRY